MPILIYPSERTAKFWGARSKWPVIFDCCIIGVAGLTLYFCVASTVLLSTRSDWTDGLFGDIGLIIVIELVVPILSILVSTLSIYLHSYSLFLPGIAITISILMLGFWGGAMVLLWLIENSTYQVPVVRVVKIVGACVEAVLYTAYFFHSARAVHRLRNQKFIEVDDGEDVMYSEAVSITEHVAKPGKTSFSVEPTLVKASALSKDDDHKEYKN